MYVIELFHDAHRLRHREEELYDQGYEKPRRNERYYTKISHFGENLKKVQFVHRTFIKKMNGYNPDEVRFHFIPNSEELALAHIRIRAKQGKVFVLGEER